MEWAPIFTKDIWLRTAWLLKKATVKIANTNNEWVYQKSANKKQILCIRSETCQKKINWSIENNLNKDGCTIMSNDSLEMIYIPINKISKL